MPSFGEKLKQEREKRKITLEEISSYTKISTRMLQALEEDKFNQLPGGIFNKGFVRAYSHFLGLDEDQTVADYLEASGDAPPISTEIVMPDDRSRENEETVSRLEALADESPRLVPWGMLAGVLLLLALVLTVWSYRRRDHAKVPPRAAVENPPTNPASPGLAGSPAAVMGGAFMPTAASPVQGPPSSSAAIAARGPGEFSVVIHARQEAWVSVTSDGQAAATELLGAGQDRAVRGRQQVMVKTGNSGGTDFLFNGKKQEVGGQFGEVKTVTFGPRGIVANAREAAPAR